MIRLILDGKVNEEGKVWTEPFVEKFIFECDGNGCVEKFEISSGFLPIDFPVGWKLEDDGVSLRHYCVNCRGSHNVFRKVGNRWAVCGPDVGPHGRVVLVTRKDGAKVTVELGPSMGKLGDFDYAFPLDSSFRRNTLAERIRTAWQCDTARYFDQEDTF